MVFRNRGAPDGRDVSLGNPDHQYPRIASYRPLWYPHGSGWAHVRRYDGSPIRNDRNLWRIHHIFFVQPSDAKPNERWRVVKSRCEYRTVGCPVPLCGLGRTYHCPITGSCILGPGSESRAPSLDAGRRHRSRWGTGTWRSRHSVSVACSRCSARSTPSQ